MVNAPCYQCDKRCAGCHSTCEEYKQFTAVRANHCAQKKLYSRTCAYFIDKARKQRKEALRKKAR